jgi:hypothetical protein
MDQVATRRIGSQPVVVRARLADLTRLRSEITRSSGDVFSAPENGSTEVVTAQRDFLGTNAEQRKAVMAQGLQSQMVECGILKVSPLESRARQRTHLIIENEIADSANNELLSREPRADERRRRQ